MNDLSRAESAELLARYRAGDDAAASELFRRYVERLTSLARVRLSRRLASRVDPEDIVLSAWRSFFAGAQDGRFAVEASGELWPLLVTITLRKVYRNVKHHTAARRSVDAERRHAGGIDEGFAPCSQEPRPEDAVVLADELEAILQSLQPFERRVLELRLRGESTRSIAADTGRPERTVRRACAALDQMLRRRAAERPEPGSTRSHIPRRPAKVRPEAGLDRVFPTKPAGPSHKLLSLEPAAPLAYGDFLLKRQIGAGHMGKVYQALDRRHGGLVAVKFLRKSFLDQPRAVERFTTEARLIAGLRHPGIVGVRGLGQTPHGGYFIVMDLIERGDLAAVMARGRIPVADAVRWTVEACGAIEHAHAHGILHCDLKPGNLLLGEDGRVRVTDFGLAQTLEDASQRLTTIAGTAPYMAPEQVSDGWGPVTPRTDVYGLGAVLYALLTGRPPFDGERIADVLSRVVSGQQVRSPRALRRSVPVSISEICRRCLAKEPERRFGSARELGNALLEQQAAISVPP